MQFLDIYCVPLLGYNISTFLNIEDQAELSATCKDARTFQTDFVYPMCKTLDLQSVSDRARTRRWVMRHLTSVSPHIHTLTPCYETSYVPLSIDTVPRLRHATLAVPLVLDVTQQTIHPSTLIAWSNLNRFIRSITIHPNNLESLRIVPGIVKLVRTNPETGGILDSYTVPDMEEGSHLRLCRVFELPIVLYGFNGDLLKGKTVHIPSQMMALSLRSELQKNKAYTDWSGHTQGYTSMLFDLFAF